MLKKKEEHQTQDLSELREIRSRLMERKDPLQTYASIVAHMTARELMAAFNRLSRRRNCEY